MSRFGRFGLVDVAVGFDLEACDEALRIERGHAAHTGRGDRLAIDVVGHIARGEDARHFGLG